MGRAGTLIDWEGESENRVYASLYTAENILNWRVERIHGRNVLTLLVLHETVRKTNVEGKAVDEFETKVGEQVRVLKLGDGCQVEIWRPKEKRERQDKAEWEKD